MSDSKKCSFSVLDFTQNGIFVIDKNYKIIFWNKYLENLAGIGRNDAIGKDVLILFPKLQKNYYREGISKVFENGTPIIFSAQIHKYIVPCKLGSDNFRTQHTTLFRVLNSEDDDHIVVFSIQDVTDEFLQIKKAKELRDQAIHEVEERKKVEERLKETVKELERNQILLETKSQNLREANRKLLESQSILKELNDNKDKFFSIIGHDLKNPIQALLGYSDILIDSFFELSDTEKLEFVTSIKKVSKNINNLLQNLLDWSRLQTGRMNFDPGMFHINNVVDSVVNLLLDNALAKRIRIINSVPTDLSIYADNFMIETVLRNLVSNAIKFTPKGGQIKMSAFNSQNTVEISVEDNGVGMDESTLHNLFKLDKSVSTRGTNDEEGTGLGLILCKELVEKNKGEIKVESQKGIGTNFRLIFRRKPTSKLILVENNR